MHARMPRRRGWRTYAGDRLSRSPDRALPSVVNAPGKPSTRGCTPLQSPPCAWCERERLPARSTLSRFLMALTQAPVEALRCLVLDALLSRPLSKEGPPGSLVDREGAARIVFDLDGTRAAASPRALPQTEELPPGPSIGEMASVPPFSTGRKRGEIVRTRTVISQSHRSQWLGSFGNPGNGHNPRATAPGPAGSRSLPGCPPALAGAGQARASRDKTAREPCLRTWLTSAS